MDLGALLLSHLMDEGKLLLKSEEGWKGECTIFYISSHEGMARELVDTATGSFPGLDSGNSPFMAINFWKIDLVFIHMGTSTKVRRTNTLYSRLCMGIVPSHFLNVYLYLLSHP